MIDLKILDKDWQVFLHSEDSFVERFGDHDAALTLPQEFEVHFCTEHLNLNTVRHELFHCYMSCLCVGSAQLEAHQLEEIAAELFAEHGDKILKMAKALHKELKDEEEL